MKLTMIPIRTLRSKLLISLFIFILLPVFYFNYGFYQSSRDIVESEMFETNQIDVDRKAQAMNDWAVRLMKTSNLLVSDPEIITFLRDGANWRDEYTKFTQFVSVQKKLSNVHDFLLDGKAGVALLDHHANVYSTWDKTTAAQYAEQVRQSEAMNGEPSWMVAPGVIPVSGLPSTHLTLSRLVKGELSQGGYGVLYIGLPLSQFFYGEEELATRRSSGMISLLAAGDGRIYGDTGSAPVGPDVLSSLHGSSTADQMPAIRTSGGKEYIVNRAAIPQLGWTYYQLMSREDFVGRLQFVQTKSIIWVSVWFAAFAVFFIIMMLRFTQPLRELARSMSRVGKGEFNSQVKIRGVDEVSLLGRHFNNMIQRLDELVVNLQLEQQRKQQAQLEALQAQINPHFLMNTLNSIKWMAILSNASHVSEMVTKLGKLIKITMRKEQELITLREELEYLHLYMSLQKLRFNDDVAIESDVPESLLDYRLPKFTLQPIVENSIIHGNQSPLYIAIHGREQDSRLILSIRDNGVGIPEKLLTEIEQQENRSDAKFSGIGIRNVNDRIRMHFGEQYGITLKNSEDGGLDVTIQLPQRKDVPV
ncbi:cache domain-containing sensor histidine kinase [Paenibacillus koleovorans]|uniref:cache domain-containing sensor histidine kinase n=1 Tax=Paenibacillus koleovorans TaxID=121608 RepID=UPI000FD6DB1D|nr:sensor histidine kinase [Paenibacillus koleovorans]